MSAHTSVLQGALLSPGRQTHEAREESYIEQHLALLNGHCFSVSYFRRIELILWHEASKQSVSPYVARGVMTTPEALRRSRYG